MMKVLQCLCALCVYGALGLRLSRPTSFDDHAIDKPEFVLTKFGKHLNPYPSWICGDGSEKSELGSDEYLEKHGHTWPTDFFAKLVNTRKATHFFKDAKIYKFPDSIIPMCQVDGMESRFESDIAAHPSFQKSQELVSNASKFFADKQQPIIFIDATNLQGTASGTISNTVCSLQRLDLSKHSVVYVYNAPESDLQRLRSLAPELTIIHQPDLEMMLPAMGHVGNRLRWIPILHFLNQGYQVLHLDGDNKLIKDPFAFLASEAKGVDAAFAYEGCLSFNGGTNFFRPTQRARQLIRTILGLKRPEITVTTSEGKNETVGMDTGDQAFLDCAISHEVVHSDLKIFAIPRQVNAFHWEDISGKLKALCKDEVNKTMENFPTFLHTCCANSPSTHTNLKSGGMWEVDLENNRCVDNYNPAAACNQRLN